MYVTPWQRPEIFPLRHLGGFHTVVFLVELQQHVRRELVPVDITLLSHINLVKQFGKLKIKKSQFF